jgi:hypothetical protein
MDESSERAPVAMYHSRRTGLFRMLLGIGRALKDAKDAGEAIRVTVERVQRD